LRKLLGGAVLLSSEDPIMGNLSVAVTEVCGRCCKPRLHDSGHNRTYAMQEFAADSCQCSCRESHEDEHFDISD